MTGAETLLDVADVSLSFDVGGGLFAPKRRLQAVRGVSFSLRRGETLAIVGESGCGKSTLARILIGLLKPDHGNVLLRGRNIRSIDRIDFARQVQPVFQDPASSLNPRRLVFDVVEQPLIVHGVREKSERQRRVKETLDLVGLPSRTFESYPRQLSGGQRQRVALARALVLRPEIVVCDEPTSALDVSIQAQILNLLQDIQSQLGVAYIFISHNLAVVEYLATEVAVMYLGRIVEMDKSEKLFAEPKHPYTQALLASLLTADPDLRVPPIDLGLSFPDPLNPPPGCAFHPRCPAAQDLCSEKAPIERINDGRRVECHFA